MPRELTKSELNENLQRLRCATMRVPWRQVVEPVTASTDNQDGVRLTAKGEWRMKSLVAVEISAARPVKRGLEVVDLLGPKP